MKTIASKALREHLGRDNYEDAVFYARSIKEEQFLRFLMAHQACFEKDLEVREMRPYRELRRLEEIDELDRMRVVEGEIVYKGKKPGFPALEGRDVVLVSYGTYKVLAEGYFLSISAGA